MKSQWVDTGKNITDDEFTDRVKGANSNIIVSLMRNAYFQSKRFGVPMVAGYERKYTMRGRAWQPWVKSEDEAAKTRGSCFRIHPDGRIDDYSGRVPLPARL